jgi:hypothetical protein
VLFWTFFLLLFFGEDNKVRPFGWLLCESNRKLQFLLRQHHGHQNRTDSTVNKETLKSTTMTTRGRRNKSAVNQQRQEAIDDDAADMEEVEAVLEIPADDPPRAPSPGGAGNREPGDEGSGDDPSSSSGSSSSSSTTSNENGDDEDNDDNDDEHHGVGFNQSDDGGSQSHGSTGNGVSLLNFNVRLPDHHANDSTSFKAKLMSFGMTGELAQIIVDNGASNVYSFARFFNKSALSELFTQEYGLDKIPMLVKQRIKIFHRWLQKCHNEGEDLLHINLEKFNDKVLESLIDEEGDGASTVRGRGSMSIKDSGLSLPTFNGNQPSYKIWNSKWRAFLSNMKNEEGHPLIYVIVDSKKESKSIQKQIKGTKLNGSRFDRDNFKVAQWLEIALADGSAHVYARKHPGDGRNGYQDLHCTYQSDSKNETRIQELNNKLKTIQYRAAKNFSWEKFTNTLIGIYEELETLKEPVDEKAQVRELIRMIAHDKTKSIAADVIFNSKKAKTNLTVALAKIGEKMTLLGVATGQGSTGDGGQDTTPSNRQIRKLKRQIKALQKKGGNSDSGHKSSGSGGGSQNHQTGGFIPKSVLDALKKTGGKNGPKYCAWLMKGRAASESGGNSESRSVKAAKHSSHDDEDQDEEDGADGDTDEDPEDTSKSASSAMGWKSKNRHSQNPNKKQRVLKAIKTVGHKVCKSASTIQHSSDYNKMARVEVDSRADTCCAGATFCMVESTDRTADVEGFHGDLGKLENIPIGTCYTAVDHPVLQETIICVFHECLYFGSKMEESLLNPNQLRAHGLVVDTCPKQFSGGKSMHGIYDPGEDFFLPFQMHGCISYFASRLPTKQEIADCRHVVFTSEAEWNPYSQSFAQLEQAYTPTSTGGAGDLAGEHHDQAGEDMRNHVVSATSSTNRRSTVDVAVLARRWGTSIATATSTLASTTTRAVRFYPENEFTRRFRTRQAQLRFPHLRTRWYSDTFEAITKSIRGNLYAQMFCNDQDWATAVPMRSKADCGDALNDVVREYGIPEHGIHTDNAGEESGAHTEWERVRKHFLIPQTFVEPHSPWMNRAEGEIGRFKSHYRRLMNRYHCPETLWCFGVDYTSGLRQCIARARLDDRTPLEVMTGETPDVSEFTDFDFYEFVIYYDPNDCGEDGAARRKLGRWLGPSKSIGQGLCYYLLKSNGRFIARSTARPITLDDYNKYPELKQEMKDFNEQVKSHIGIFDDSLILQSEADDPEEALFVPVPNGGGLPEGEGFEEEAEDGRGFDPLISAQLVLPHKEGDMMAKVIKRKRDSAGNLVGRKHRIPTLDSRVYEVEFIDGVRQEIAYNVLAEHLLCEMDEEGNQYQIFKDIVDHRKHPKKAVEKADQYYTKGGRQYKKRTTTGWELEVEWKDGSTSWLPLKTLKETNPIRVADYAKANRIDTEPAFEWWVPTVLRRRKRIIKGAVNRHQRAGYKFGIALPHNIADAKRLDQEAGNTLWMDALRKEMDAVMIAFEVQPEEVKHVPGYKRIPGHIIWDVKMDFTRKARYVAGGHRTDPPKAITYSSVVSRESVRIALLLAGLNDLEIRLTDIGNAYLTAPITEKCYVVAGDEFGPQLKGRVLKIVRALYGLKSAGAAFHAHLASILRNQLHFKPCEADPDVWMRAAVKPDGTEYYDYVLCYVDDVMIISAKPDEIADELKAHFVLKEVLDPGQERQRYLGAMIGKYTFADGSQAWYMSAKEYLSKATPAVEAVWDEKLYKKASSPLPANYHPELDTTPLLSEDDAQLYGSYIGILQWANELARIDLTQAVSLMSRFRNAPREGHMQALLRVFGYIKGRLNAKVVFDCAYRDWTKVDWHEGDWKLFYPDAEEPIPPRAPEPRGNEVQINIFCDAAHATCLATRRSTTGILVYLNGAPIKWYSKRQNTVESSTFGSEFVSLKIAMEMNAAIRYKLRMMGVPIDGPTSMFGDNQSVVQNVTKPESVLNKRHNAIAYHKCREEVAAGAARLAHESGKENCSDGLTKILTGSDFFRFVQAVMYH